MNRINKIINNPTMLFIWGLVVDALIMAGYIPGEYRDKWVNDGFMLIGGMGFVIFWGLFLHHKLDHSKKQSLAELEDSLKDNPVVSPPVTATYFSRELFTPTQNSGTPVDSGTPLYSN